MMRHAQRSINHEATSGEHVGPEQRGTRPGDSGHHDSLVRSPRGRMLFTLLLACSAPIEDTNNKHVLVISTGSAIGHRLLDGALGLGQLSFSFGLHEYIEP